MTPYYTDDRVQLYLGDCREVLPALGVTADLVVADPPYGETSLAWDTWPEEWLQVAAGVAQSLWCFGSMRMFLQRGREFDDAGWKLSQDVVWEKPVGSGFAADRFRRVHETAAHWYRGPWTEVHHDAPREPYSGPPMHHGHHGVKRAGVAHTGTIGSEPWVDDGTRLMRSVIKAPQVRGGHPTEKPTALLELLIAYGCPPGGLVVDPMAGSGSTLDAARQSGRRAIGVEAHEPYCEAAAKRLAQDVLPLDPEETPHVH